MAKDLLSGLPCWDNHLHLDPAGLNIRAAEEFIKAGGTGFTLVHKPYHHISITSPEDYLKSYEVTLRLAEDARKAGCIVKVVIGPHPSELTELIKDGLYLEDAKTLLLKGLDVAAKLISEGKADGFGEVGRPHYPVEPAVWAASNEILRYAFQLAQKLNVPVFLHTEQATREVFKEIAQTALEAGLDLNKVVKHFSPPFLLKEDNAGLFPSIVASKESLLKAIEYKRSGNLRFAMETDYIDDLSRPGAVLGHLTVPKRTRWLLQEGYLTPEDCIIIHRHNIEMIFGKF